jgi:chemotaxis protein histidine kinase CheA
MTAMKGRKWVRIDADEYERLMNAEAEAQEKIRMANKLRDEWLGEAQSAQLERNDAEDYIKRLEAALERVRTELVEYKRMYADEVEKRLSGLAVLMAQEMGKEASHDGDNA